MNPGEESSEPTAEREQHLVRVGVLKRALAELDDVHGLKRLHDELEAVQRLAKRLRLALVDQNRVAELRIRAARKAGIILSRTVARGGKSNSHGGSSNPLPEGISWNQSSRWQQLAKIPGAALESYLKKAAEEEDEVTVAGFQRAATGGAEGGEDVGAEQQGSDLSPHFSTDSVQWYTPQAVVDLVVEVMGGIDLDPCADPGKAIPAAKHFTEDDDGLAHPWAGRVYMNPPYGAELPKWVEHLVGEYEAKRVEQAVALVPSRTDTGWFHRLRDFPRCFVNGRLRFSGSENSAPFPSMCVYLGGKRARFRNVFAQLGDVYELMR